MAKCYRVGTPPNPRNTEPVVAPPMVPNADACLGNVVTPKSEVEELFGGAGGLGDGAAAPTSGFFHGSPRLKASTQSLIPAESTVSA